MGQKSLKYLKIFGIICFIWLFVLNSSRVFSSFEVFVLASIYSIVLFLDYSSFLLSPFFIHEIVSWLKYYFVLNSENSLFINLNKKSIELLQFNIVEQDQFNFTFNSLIFWFSIIIILKIIRNKVHLSINFSFNRFFKLVSSKYVLLFLSILIISFVDFSTYYNVINSSSRQTALGEASIILRILSVYPILCLFGTSFKYSLLDLLIFLFALISIFLLSLSRFYLFLGFISYVLFGWKMLKGYLKLLSVIILVIGAVLLSAFGELRQEFILNADIRSIDIAELIHKNLFDDKKAAGVKDEILGINAFGQFAINTEESYYGYGYLPVLLTPFPSFLLPFVKPNSLGEDIVRKRGLNTGLPFSAYTEAKLNFGSFFILGAFFLAVFYFFTSSLHFEKIIINIVLVIMLVEPNTISLVMFCQMIILLLFFSKVNVHIYNK